jgi:predicted nucleotidyltransferase component of viral defense system
MLQTQSVGKPLWNLLRDLQKRELFKNYFLVGGTALSLQLGHRVSNDIDLFTRNDINIDTPELFTTDPVRFMPNSNKSLERLYQEVLLDFKQFEINNKLFEKTITDKIKQWQQS